MRQGDVVPGHTGTGADFQLALMNYGDYPSLYHMIEIPQQDWNLLPPPAPGTDYINLKKDQAEVLAQRGYIDGNFDEIMFYVPGNRWRSPSNSPGVKETNWAATR